MTKIAFLFEWDAPKNEDRRKEASKYQAETLTPYFQKMVEEKQVKVEIKLWQDIEGRFHEVAEFESVNELAKVWNKEWLDMWGQYMNLIDNFTHSVMWPSDEE